ncbi:MAG: hypothetical protein ACRCVU_01875 [Flavobacterium sp.]
MLIIIGMPCVYGQSIISNAGFTSAASVVYLESNPYLYFSDANVRFYNGSKPKFVPKKVNKYEEKDDLETLMRNKYRLLNSNVVFNHGFGVDVSNYSKKDEYVREYRNDFSFLENLFLDLLIGILP